MAKVWRRTVNVPKGDGSIGRREEAVAVKSIPAPRSLQGVGSEPVYEWLVRPLEDSGRLLGHFASEERCRFWLLERGYKPSPEGPDPEAAEERAA